MYILYIYVFAISSTATFFRDYTQMLLEKSPVRLEVILATCEEIRPQKVDLGYSENFASRTCVF